MAEIEIQRKQSGVAWWTWLLMLFVVGLLTWWVVATLLTRNNTQTATTSATGTTTSTATSAAAPEPATAALPIAAALANPDAYFGTQVSGLTAVTAVLGERAFVVEQDGARMYAVLSDGVSTARDIAPGTRVSLTGTFVNPDQMRDKVPGILALGDATLKSLQGEPAFLHVTNIEVQQGNGTTATSRGS